MFIARPNQEGEIEWVVDSEETEEADETLSELLASSHYLDMFNDKRRNAAYRLAIEKAVTPGMSVLDIGTGTGLLALLAGRALRSGAKESSGMVTACEVFPPMAHAARKVIERNGYADTIKVFNKRSDELIVGEDLPGKVDVIVSEIVDSLLLGEGILPTMRHASANLLKAGGIMIPHSATIWIQLVESGYLAKRAEQSLSQGNEQFFKELDVSPLYPGRLQPVSKPICALSFAFDGLAPGNAEKAILIPFEGARQTDAVVLWWDLQLDQAGDVVLSTRPVWVADDEVHSDRLPKQEWREHWKTSWAPLLAKSPSHQGGMQVLLKQYETEVSISTMPDSQTSAPSSCDAQQFTIPTAVSPLPNKASLVRHQVLDWRDQLVEVVQGQATLWCMAISMPDYARTHQPLSIVEGFDMSSCNRMLGAEGTRRQGWQNTEEVELWQCGPSIAAASERLALETSTLDSDMLQSVQSESSITFKGHLSLMHNLIGRDAIVFWTTRKETTDSEEIDPFTPNFQKSSLLLLSEAPAMQRLSILVKVNIPAQSMQARVLSA